MSETSALPATPNPGTHHDTPWHAAHAARAEILAAVTARLAQRLAPHIPTAVEATVEITTCSQAPCLRPHVRLIAAHNTAGTIWHRSVPRPLPTWADQAETLLEEALTFGLDQQATAAAGWRLDSDDPTLCHIPLHATHGAQPATPSRTRTHLLKWVVNSHYGGDATSALLDLAAIGQIAVNYLDRDWFTRYLREQHGIRLTDETWEKLAAELGSYDEHVCRYLQPNVQGDFAEQAAIRAGLLDQDEDPNNRAS